MDDAADLLAADAKRPVDMKNIHSAADLEALGRGLPIHKIHGTDPVVVFANCDLFYDAVYAAIAGVVAFQMMRGVSALCARLCRETAQQAASRQAR